MNKIELFDGNPSILKKDKNRIDIIYKTFGYSNDTRLIPQCFWGNIKDPKIIILAKNPSCVTSDYLDNKYFGKKLIENLNIENRSDDVVNLLFSDSLKSGIPFELSGVSNWWRSFFSLSVDDDKSRNIMNSICIINLCGYYKTRVGKIKKELFWFYDEEKENRINDVVENVFKNKNLEHVIYVWTRNEDNQWNEVLKSLNVREEIISCANNKNRYHPHINITDFLLEGDGVMFYYPIYNKDKKSNDRYVLSVAKDYKMSTLVKMHEGENPIYNNSDFICENMRLLLCWKANHNKDDNNMFSYNEIMEKIDELHAVLYALSYDADYQRYNLNEEEIASIITLKNEYTEKIMKLSEDVSRSFIEIMNKR